MKKTLFLVIMLVLGSIGVSNASSFDERPVYELKADLQKSYHLINTSLKDECGLVADSLHQYIVVEFGRATIFYVVDGADKWFIELSESGSTKTKMEFSSDFKVHLKYASRIAAHVNKDLRGCFLDNVE